MGNDGRLEEIKKGAFRGRIFAPVNKAGRTGLAICFWGKV
jgi:hypothetical protein